MAGPERLTVKSRNVSKGSRNRIATKTNPGGKNHHLPTDGKTCISSNIPILIPEKPPQQQFDGSMRTSAVITS
jgi:hypothetical protein